MTHYYFIAIMWLKWSLQNRHSSNSCWRRIFSIIVLLINTDDIVYWSQPIVLISGRSQRPLSGGREKTGVQISVELFMLPLQEGVIFISSLSISPHHGDTEYFLLEFLNIDKCLYYYNTSTLYSYLNRNL